MMSEVGERPRPSFEPYKPSLQDALELRERLISRGYRFEGLSAEETGSLVFETQFRNLEIGRGPGVVAVMGREPAERMLEWALAVGKRTGGKRIISSKTGEPIEGTQGRGVQQTIADILAMSHLAVADPLINEESVQETTRKINQRILRALLRQCKDDPAAKEAVLEAFSEFADPLPTSKTTSLSAEALKEVLAYLTGGQ